MTTNKSKERYRVIEGERGREGKRGGEGKEK